MQIISILENNDMRNRVLTCLLVLFLTFSSCGKQGSVNDATINPYKTKNVIIVMVDGPRYSETWGDTTHQYIPRLANELAESGVVYTAFYNDGPTYTNAGHTAITTGNYQEINNNGKELPQHSSIFQHWLKSTNNLNTAAWIITSKDKLEVLADCKEANWTGQFKPSTNCGISGLGSGYRPDSITFKNSLQILSTQHPQLVLINFREPDSSGHSGDWENYLKGIRDTDDYIYQLWQFIEHDPHYKETTTLFVTNDHGRHLDDVRDGFINHGCDCDGCRHINLFAAGPDFKKGIIENTRRGQIDIPATVSELMNFQLPTGKGAVMKELFKKD